MSSWSSMMKIEGSGSTPKCHGSATLVKDIANYGSVLCSGAECPGRGGPAAEGAGGSAGGRGLLLRPIQDPGTASHCISYFFFIRFRINDMYRLDEGVVWGFPRLGANGWRFCRKTQKEPAKCLYCRKTKKEPAKCMYCVRCTLFPAAAEPCARLAGNFCQYWTTVKSGANGMVWLNVWYFTAS